MASSIEPLLVQGPLRLSSSLRISRGHLSPSLSRPPSHPPTKKIPRPKKSTTSQLSTTAQNIREIMNSCGAGMCETEVGPRGDWSGDWNPEPSHKPMCEIFQFTPHTSLQLHTSVISFFQEPFPFICMIEKGNDLQVNSQLKSGPPVGAQSRRAHQWQSAVIPRRGEEPLYYTIAPCNTP